MTGSQSKSGHTNVFTNFFYQRLVPTFTLSRSLFGLLVGLSSLTVIAYPLNLKFFHSKTTHSIFVDFVS